MNRRSFFTAALAVLGLAGLVGFLPRKAFSLDECLGRLEALKARLLKALKDFDAFTGEYGPHFAYGALTKDEYRNAHIMHIDQHLTEIHL